MYVACKCKCANVCRPRMEKSRSGRPRTERFPSFWYCQVVNCQLLRLLSTNILVHQCLAVNLPLKVSKIQDLIIEPISFLWSIIFTFCCTRVRQQCNFSILGRKDGVAHIFSYTKVCWHICMCVSECKGRACVYVSTYSMYRGTHTQICEVVIVMTRGQVFIYARTYHICLYIM